MRSPRRASSLKASFVVTLGGLAGCRGTNSIGDPPRNPPPIDRGVTPPQRPRPADHMTPASVFPGPGGRCNYRQAVGQCPPDIACNPPPMLQVDCPDAGVASPPEHPGWLRVKPGFYSPPSSTLCFFTPERWCPPAGSVEACTSTHDLSFQCAPQDGQVTVESFSYEVAPGRCARVPTFRCSTAVGACDVPASEPAACDASTRR